MPRRDYKRYFARDREGNYAGTEQPEREWDEEDLAREFGWCQEMALRSVPEAGRRRSSERGGSVDGEEGVSGRDFGKEGDGKGAKSEEMWWL